MSVTQAYVLDSTLKMYFGTAAERAAMETSGIATGSRFYESDNNLELIWTGSGWISWLLHTVA